jgi:uncharacterized phage-associated protein
MAETQHNELNPFKLNHKKALQAIAFLLKQRSFANNSDNYMRTLKLLYFADRESLSETGMPITGDYFVALPCGPTLSSLLNLVKQEGSEYQSEWDKYIQKEGFDIRLIQDPGNDRLSRYEVELLKKIWLENREKDEWTVAGESEKLPEWRRNNPGQSSKYIPLSHVLEALGKLNWLPMILETAEENNEMKRILKIES